MSWRGTVRTVASRRDRRRQRCQLRCRPWIRHVPTLPRTGRRRPSVSSTVFLCLVLAPLIGAAPAVKAPPESVFAKFRESDRDVARRFYKKCLEIDGVPVLASADVADEALQRTHEIVIHLLAGSPDILEALAKYGTRLIIIGKDQVYTDMPEYRD